MNTITKLNPNKITDSIELLYSLDGWYFQDIDNPPMKSQFFNTLKEAVGYFYESSNVKAGDEIFWIDHSLLEA